MQYNSDEQLATLVEVARLYYEEGLSQREIADSLSVSRSLIALYLQKARDRGIVRIEVVNPQDAVVSLALEIQESTQIEEIIVVPHGDFSPELTRRSIAGAAAKLLAENLADGDILGLVWGRTITHVVELLAPSSPRKIEVLPLLGESSYGDTYTHMNELVLNAAKQFNGRPHFLLAPLVVGSKSLRDGLLSDPAVQRITNYWEQVTVACFGIGVLPPAPGQIPYLLLKHLDPSMSSVAVGDLCAIYHFDIQGNLLENELQDKVIGVRIDQLLKANRRIAVASGIEKAPAVVGALRTGLITTLIIDLELAREVILQLKV
jgi:DNA-binding transcriptional regulator LsrR (DeoR family)